MSCKEMHSGELGISRRLQISGLKNAKVRIFPNDNTNKNSIHFYLNTTYPWKEGKLPFSAGEKEFGNNYVVENVTGELVVSW